MTALANGAFATAFIPCQTVFPAGCEQDLTGYIYRSYERIPR